MNTDEHAIKTMETPEPSTVVGRYFGGHSMQTEQSEVYICDSYDPRMGYWLTSVSIDGKVERKNVSERAIGRTYWPADSFDDHWFITQWGKRVEKPKRSILEGEYTLRVVKLDENKMLILGRGTRAELFERAHEYLQEHCSDTVYRRCEIEDPNGGRVMSDPRCEHWYHSPYAHWPDEKL